MGHTHGEDPEKDNFAGGTADVSEPIFLNPYPDMIDKMRAVAPS